MFDMFVAVPQALSQGVLPIEPNDAAALLPQSFIASGAIASPVLQQAAPKFAVVVYVSGPDLPQPPQPK